jgi:hypothetical protein
MTRRVVAFAVAAYLLLVFADRFVLVELLIRRTAIPFLLASAVGLACLGAGFLARRKREMAMNFAIGYPIFGTACFLVGCMKIATWTMWPLVVLFAIAGVWSLVEDSRPRLSLSVPPIAVIIVLILGFIAAQAPPHSLDELAYHLAVPWSWVKEGRAIDLPLISHSYFPLGVESADLPLLAAAGATHGGIASHFLHLFAAIAAVALINDRFVAAAIASAPVLAVTAGWSLVDWNLLAVALALMRSLDEEDARSITAAVAAGMLTKYTFVPFVAIAIWKARKPAIIGALAGSVFYLRNLVLTTNPFAPFLTATAPHVAHYRGGAYLSDYVFDGRFIDESLGASLLGTSVATAGAAMWGLFALGIVLFLLAPSARILVPFFAVPASRAKLEWKPLRIVIGIAIALQLLLIGFFLDRNGDFSTISGADDEASFLTRARPSYASIRAIDAALPADSRTLVVGLSETYWFAHRVRGAGNFDGPRISSYLDAPSAEALRERLRRDGITHIAIMNAAPATAVAKKIEERETALTPSAKRSMALMLDHYAAAVTQHQGSVLFALR